jgi:hypothetical protein
MKLRRAKNGRPQALDGVSLLVGYALGCKVPLRVVAKLAGVSPTTVRKHCSYALENERLEDLLRTIHDAERFG